MIMKHAKQMRSKILYCRQTTTSRKPHVDSTGIFSCSRLSGYAMTENSNVQKRLNKEHI